MVSKNGNLILVATVTFEGKVPITLAKSSKRQLLLKESRVSVC